ncbi:MAG TPA: DUF6580 family putative transport protein [Phycisphaerales bacterium]|nr:DUF6580 family putative transport protein [Phycisphaerales bacterium]
MRKPLLLQLAALFVLILIASLGRLASDTPNLTPVAAAGLFAAYLFRRSWLGVIVPLSAMLITVFFFRGFYDLRLMAVVYASLAFPALLRKLPGAKLSAWRTAGASVLGSLFFFITTNLAEWTMMGHYKKTVDGFIECFAAALPFFWNTLAGDLAWNTAFFGAYALALAAASSRRANGAIDVHTGRAAA